MATFTSIDTERLRLRRFAERDIARLAAYRDDPDVARYQSWSTFSPAEAVELVRRQADQEPGDRGVWFPFAVVSRADDLLLGDCSLCADAHDDRLAEIGFTFAPDAQGRGFAGEAVRAVLDRAFGELGLHRVRAVIDVANQRAARLAERVGMVQEAHFRQHVWFKGRWCDELVFAILAADWRARR